MADSHLVPSESEHGPQPPHRLSSLRLETFSDGVFAIAITLLALQLRPPDLDGVTTVGGAAGGLLLLGMALTRIAFVLVCLGVRAELGASEATTELVMPTLLRSAGAVVLLLAIAAVVTGNPPYAGTAVCILVAVYLLVVRLVVRTWRVRHRRRLAG
jgi:uncharacterized membrane protein